MKILLGALKEKAEELASFLEPRVGTKPSPGGSEIEIDDSSVRQGIKPRHVKTYVKRFLHKVGQRRAYRVLVSGTELSIVQLEGKVEEEVAKPEEKKGEVKPEPPKEEEPKEKKNQEAEPARPKKKTKGTKKEGKS